MFAPKLLRQKNIYNSKLNCLLKKYSKQAIASGVECQEKITFSPHREKKSERKPILQSLVLDHLSEELFTFPEALTIERFQDFFNWLKPIENYISSCADADKKLNKKEVLDNLKELNVFQAHMEEDYGLNLLETESLKLLETVSAVPWLGTYLVKNNILPIKIISKYGSISQKQEYYPKIISGEVIPTICINEGDNGTNINNIRSQVIPIEGGAWLLNGEKTFVPNGINSNLFLVFVRSISKTSRMVTPDSFSLLLVENDQETVSCSKVHETIGRHELPTCTINFKDTVIPGKNIIGEPGTAFNILMDIIQPGNQNIAAQAIGILRGFTNQLITDILKFKHFDRDLYEFDFVKNTLGEIIFTLYTMESMAYFTSGLIDLYKKPGVNIEKVITENYCANKCLKCIQAGMQLMGAHSYLNNTSYIQMYHDALALTTLDMNNMDANTYIAAAFLQNMGAAVHEHVFKKRNSAFFPLYNLMDSLFDKSDTPLDMSSYLHPSLKLGAQHFQAGINEFRDCINKILIQEGSEIMTQYSLLGRIAEMLTEMYAGFANLSRSSRSYCIGLRNTDIEKHIGLTMGYVSYYNTNFVAHQLNTDSFSIANKFHKEASEEAYAKHRYYLEHPLSRTLF